MTGFTSSFSRLRLGSLLFCAAVIVYASLYPFGGWRYPDFFTLLSWPRYWSGFDMLLNLVAYLPLGGLLASLLIQRHASIKAGVFTVCAAFCFSFLMEFIQLWLPGRVSSPVDLLANSLGAAIGAVAVLSPPGKFFLRYAIGWRFRVFSPGAATDWGLLLLLLWLFAQLNPAIPFFDAGFVSVPPVGNWRIDSDEFWLAHILGIAFNVCGFALFASLLVRLDDRGFYRVAMLLVIGFFAKVVMAALMLKAPLMSAWINRVLLFGVVIGLLLFVVSLRLRYRWRAFIATLLIFAGGLMAKMAQVDDALDVTLRLFDWPYGQLVNFAGVTHWVHEIWPVGVFVFLATVFVSTRRI